ncbi:MAG: cytidine deaminase [Bacteroidales bacterium]|nr:cytidine deaminase [Bacteroidales bacterium]
MQEKEIRIPIRVYPTITELPKSHQELILRSRQALTRAYAPYSHFRVGAAILLGNGEIIEGNNQENVAFPSGLCAERVAMFYASSRFPDVDIEAIAVAGNPIQTPITPCGSCRQVLSEYEWKQKRPIRIFLTGLSEEIWELNSVNDLLPLSFNHDLKKK